MKAQRLRVTFTRGEPLRFISHLDLMRFWERALRRAGLVVAYSEGFSPHPQIALGAPLPVGTTGAAELMDVFLAEPVSPGEFLRRVGPQLPVGVTISAVHETPLTLPSLQSQLRAATYRVTLAPETEPDALEARVADFLTRTSVPWEHKREHEVKRYDLRPLVLWLQVVGNEPPALEMLLRADPGATGRPDQIIAALGLPPPVRVHRLRLYLADDPLPGAAPQAAQASDATNAGAHDRAPRTAAHTTPDGSHIVATGPLHHDAPALPPVVGSRTVTLEICWSQCTE